VEKLVGADVRLRGVVRRYLQSVANMDDGASKRLVEELRAGRYRVGLAKEVFDMLAKEVKVRSPLPQITVVHESDSVVLKYGKFKFDIMSPRYNVLVQLGSPEEIMLSALRHAALMMPTRRCWGSTFNGRVLEGFSSPFSSQVMMSEGFVDGVDNKSGYCSLFPEDKALGSLGDFFKTRLFGTVIVKPPAVESILLRAAERCIESKCEFIFYGPAWPNAEYYTLLAGYCDREYDMELTSGAADSTVVFSYKKRKL